jgi:hypothetical protein
MVILPAMPALAVFRPDGANGDRSGENLAADCDGILAKKTNYFSIAAGMRQRRQT